MTPEPAEPIRPGWWMTCQAWLDGDGIHVWMAHDCSPDGTPQRVVDMLPWPVWHSNGAGVEPSFSCDNCGVHTIVRLGVPDDDRRCHATFEHDGRWCERIMDHPGLHQNDMASWGTYSRATGDDHG